VSLFNLSSSICHLLKVLLCVCGTVTSYDLYDTMFDDYNKGSTISGYILYHNISVPVSTYFYVSS